VNQTEFWKNELPENWASGKKMRLKFIAPNRSQMKNEKWKMVNGKFSFCLQAAF
jgi:hypothetical protein